MPINFSKSESCSKPKEGYLKLKLERSSKRLKRTGQVPGMQTRTENNYLEQNLQMLSSE
jgi:hypothetical protein